MTTHIKEKIYHGISLFCIVLCFWLIGQVAADELVGGGAAEHLPPVRTLTEEQGQPQGIGFTITEEQIEGKLMKYMPDGMLIGQPQITIRADGQVTFVGTVEKSALLEIFRQKAIDPPGGSLLTVLAPKQIEVEMAVCCLTGEGKPAIRVDHLIVAGNRIEGELLPKVLADGVNTMLSTVLSAEGMAFTSMIFTNGAIYCK